MTAVRIAYQALAPFGVVSAALQAASPVPLGEQVFVFGLVVAGGVLVTGGIALLCRLGRGNRRALVAWNVADGEGDGYVLIDSAAQAPSDDGLVWSQEDTG